MNCKYKEICMEHGCKCKVFNKCPANFGNQIGNPELVVIFTGAASHKMLNTASKQVKKNGTKIAYVHSSSASALKNALAEHFARF